MISNVTPLWAHNNPCITEMTVPIVSERAARTIYRFGDIVHSEHHSWCSAATKVDVNTPTPLQRLAMRGRVAPGGQSDPLDETQALDLTTAIACQTIGAAHAAAGWSVRPARSRSASWPTSSCSTAICTSSSRPTTRTRACC